MSRPAGFTAIELLAGLALGSMVLATLVLLLQPVLDQTVRAPESADLLERGRAADVVLREALAGAGSGAELLGHGGFTDVAPGVWPRRLGRWSADADGSAWADRFTVVSVPWLAPQAPLGAPLAAGTTAVPLAVHPACGLDVSCGFRAGDHVAVLDAGTGVEFDTVRAAGPGWVERTQPAAGATPATGAVAAVEMSVFYFDAARRQLRRYDGVANDQPVVDDVVWMAVRYYADPLPPVRPALAGAPTCVVDADGVALLSLLGPAPGPLVELTPGDLSDGPWCGHAPWSFDGDLLRVRGVRVRLRLQAASPAVRGLGAAFQLPGQAPRRAAEVADVELDVFVTPRLAGGG